MSQSRVLTETEDHEKRITSLEDRMDRLYNERAHPPSGIVAEMRDDLKKLTTLAFAARYVFLGCFFAMGIMMMLTGSGTVSLSALLKFLGK